MADSSSGSAPATNETDAEKEIREAQEARDRYQAAQQKVIDRATADRDAMLAPYKSLTEAKEYKKVEELVTAMFTTDGVMNDRSLFQSLQNVQESMRILRENTATRANTAPTPVV